MMSKRLFIILDEMNDADGINKTANVGVCNGFISADKVKGGAKIAMGAPESALYDIMNDTVIPILLLINKAEYKRLSEDD